MRLVKNVAFILCFFGYTYTCAFAYDAGLLETKLDHLNGDIKDSKKIQKTQIVKLIDEYTDFESSDGFPLGALEMKEGIEKVKLSDFTITLHEANVREFFTAVSSLLGEYWGTLESAAADNTAKATATRKLYCLYSMVERVKEDFLK